jgi:hypothetical protein
VRLHSLVLVSTALCGSLFDLASVVYKDISGSSTGGAYWWCSSQPPPQSISDELAHHVDLVSTAL